MKITLGRLAAAAAAGAVIPAMIVPATGAVTHAAHAGTGTVRAMLTGTASSGSNAELGQRMAAAAGWTGGQWQCLNWLWTRESSWLVVWNYQGSGAYGIAQALGHGNANTQGTVANAYGPLPGMNLPGSTYVGANSGNPADQITWGLTYIRLAYGTPCGAWNHETSAGWY